MTHRFSHATFFGAIAYAFSVAAGAVPIAGSPYYADPQESYVFDQTSEAINTVNMITCIFDAMNPEKLVNAGNYVALVDENRCDSSNRSNSSNSGSTSGGSNATKLTRAVVNSSRASASASMRVRAWIENEEQGQSSDIFVNLSASEEPSTSNPYGSFRLDFCGKNPGGCKMQGYLAGASTGITFAETESNGGHSRQLFLTKGGADSGAGAVRSVESNGGGGPTTTTYQFSFNQSHFLRRAGSTDACFDRSLANSKSSVWRYGVYDATGQRVNRTGGFPISYTHNGTNYQGWAGYYGINLPSDALATLATGGQVTRQSFGNGGAETSYDVVRARGRLTKYTRQSASLAAFANVRFNFGPYAGLSNTTANAIKSGENNSTIRSFQLETYWDANAGTFKVSGYQNCSSNGCQTRSLSSPIALTNTDLSLYSNGMFGWSQSYGGPIAILSTTMSTIIAASPSGQVQYRTQDLVYPGSLAAPSNLYCVADCPTASEIAGLVANVTQDPFASGTERQYAPTGTAPLAYTFNAVTGNLEQGGTPVVVASNVTSDQLTGQYRGGIRSGRMLESPTAFACSGQYCAQKADEADVYYEWETGANSWNQFIGLKSAGNYLTFDPPLSLTYTVPNDSVKYGESAGSTIVLQYSGFGELQGVPGHCVSPATNLPVSCDGGSARYVPAFSIPESLTEGVLHDSSGGTYFAKWLNREVRFNKVLDATCAPLQASLGSLSNLPSLTGLSNPADPNDPIYIGAKPSLTSAPRVIDGVTQ